MLRSKYSVWLVRLTIATIIILGLQPNAIAQSGEETAYTLQPLASSAQGDSGQSYLGLNPAQALQIVFTPQALDISAQPSGDRAWHLGWQLESYTREGAEVAGTAAAATVVDGNRIQYQHENLSEWYVNEERGLKHGFTLNGPPGAPVGDALLQLRLQVNGDLSPVVSSDGQAIDFVLANGAALLRYDALHVFDAEQSTLPAFFTLTQNGFAIQVDDSQAVYPITVDPLLTNYLVKRTAPIDPENPPNPPDNPADDHFAHDVNFSHNIATVGVPNDDNENGADAGVAYLYDYALGGSGKWAQRARLIAAGGTAGDLFGTDTYITFGVTATVGAPGDTNGAGAVYLYAKDQGGPNMWGQLGGKIVANDREAGDGFGSAVAVQHRTLVIGAPGKDIQGNADAGAIYISFRQNPIDPLSWSQPTRIVAADGEAGDEFGAAVVVSGNYIIVGAPGDDNGAGSVYVYEGDQDAADQWVLLDKFTAEDVAVGDAEPGDRFGTSLNYSGGRFIVGAPGDDEKGSDAGAAYVFDLNFGVSGVWSPRPKIMAPDGAAGDQFGRSVGLGGNIASVGAPFDDDNGNDSGSAYLVFFRKTGEGAWGNAIKINAADGANGDQFGYSVDQRSGRIVIGAPMEDDAGSNAGAVYFYNTPFDLGTLQIANNVEPNDPNTNWNYAVEGILTHSEVITGDSQTAPAFLFPGVYTVTESAGLNTDLSDYTTTWSCTNNGNPGVSGEGSTLTVTIGLRQNVVCNFTHLLPGTVTIRKETRSGAGTGFSFADNIEAPNSFALDANTEHTFINVASGTYQVTETVPSDWRLTSIACPDPDGGSSTSGATATIDLDAGETAICTFTNKEKAGIAVLKSADVTIATVGQTVTYSYSVINDSQDELTGVVAVDDKLGAVTLGKTTLQPGEETTGTLTYTIQATDLPGPLANTVVVSGTPPAAPVVTDTVALEIGIVGNAAIQLAVTANPTAAPVDDSVTYSYRITNTGSTLLTDVHVANSRLGAVTLVDTSLQPGESTSGTQVYLVKQSDLPGPLADTVSAGGKPPLGAEVEASASVSVDLFEIIEESSIDVTISASLTSAKVGDTITYSYEVQNSGAAPLTNVMVTDSRLGAVPLAATTLEPGASTSGTMTYTVQEGDLPGPLTDTATATGTPSSGDNVEDAATVSVTLLPTLPDSQESLSLPLIAR